MAERKAEKTKRVRACYAPDHASALQMAAVLNSRGIDAVVDGGVRDIYQVGSERIGEEILVPPESLSEAQDILSQMTGASQSTPDANKSVGRTLIGLGAAAILLGVLLILRGFLF